jgi:hypothetical protein
MSYLTRRDGEGGVVPPRRRSCSSLTCASDIPCQEINAVCREPHTQAVSAYLQSESEETP